MNGRKARYAEVYLLENMCGYSCVFRNKEENNRVNIYKAF